MYWLQLCRIILGWDWGQHIKPSTFLFLFFQFNFVNIRMVIFIVRVLRAKYSHFPASPDKAIMSFVVNCINRAFASLHYSHSSLCTPTVSMFCSSITVNPITVWLVLGLIVNTTSHVVTAMGTKQNNLIKELCRKKSVWISHALRSRICPGLLGYVR